MNLPSSIARSFRQLQAANQGMNCAHKYIRYTPCVYHNFYVMAVRGRRFAAERAAEMIANLSSDENDDEIDDGLSDYDDADAEPLLEDESDDTDDDSGTEERNYQTEAKVLKK